MWCVMYKMCGVLYAICMSVVCIIYDIYVWCVICDMYMWVLCGMYELVCDICMYECVVCYI